MGDKVNKSASTTVRQQNFLKKKYRFDSITEFSDGSHADGRRYYKARKGKVGYFIKSGSSSYENEYSMAKKAFDKSSKYFAEPVDCISGEVNYLVTKWLGGVGLDEFMATETPTKRQRDNFAKDLCAIYEVLQDIGIVHRDIIPRNLIVTSDHLKLIDFYWAVDCDRYRNRLDVDKDLSLIGNLGEAYAKGHYVWDDAYSLLKIADFVGIDRGNSYVERLAASLESRSITPHRDDFFNEIVSMGVELDTLYRQNFTLKNEIATVESLRSEVAKQIEVITGLRSQVEVLQRELKEIQNSHSWRITKPIRSAARIVNRMKGQR